MAKKVIEVFTDDIDGSKADDTVKFALDGTAYEIDLNGEHAEELRTDLARWIVKARRIGRVTRIGRQPPQSFRTGGSGIDPAQRRAIREWALAKGHRVSDRGRIPEQILAKYEAEAGRG